MEYRVFDLPRDTKLDLKIRVHVVCDRITMSTEGQDTIFGSSYREGRKKKFGSLVNLSCLFVLCFQSDKSPFFFPVSSLTLQYSYPITLFLFNNSTSFYVRKSSRKSILMISRPNITRCFISMFYLFFSELLLFIFR